MSRSWKSRDCAKILDTWRPSVRGTTCQPKPVRMAEAWSWQSNPPQWSWYTPIKLVIPELARQASWPSSCTTAAELADQAQASELLVKSKGSCLQDA
eukprot:1344276-Amphidinium_carterae.3